MKSAIFVLAAAAAAFAAGSVAAADGKAIFDKNCGVCHKVMPPKLGDKAQWAPRLKQGTDALVQSVMKGKGAMPAKGGHAALTQEDIKAAVLYIQSQVK